MAKLDPNKLEITELFMAQADVDRRFFGIIKRLTDDSGNRYCYSEIKVNSGTIYARAKDQDQLGRRLDELCIMVLDCGLHNNRGVKIELFHKEFSLN